MHCALRLGGQAVLKAREGRENQRYGANGERLLAGCIPVRFCSDKEGADAVQIMLISRKGGRGWALPKGGWELDEEVHAAAEREAVEEAGIRGVLVFPEVGMYTFQSEKDHSSHYICTLFLMQVCEELEWWPERDQRQRHWFSLPDAIAMCTIGWMQQALAQWAYQNGWYQPHAFA